MPARVSIEMNEECLARVIAELELSNPPSFTLNHSGRYDHPDIPKHGRARGMYEPVTNHVDITSQNPAYEREGLYVLTKHVRFTVLHELRHAWQREHWTEEQKTLGRAGNYCDRFEEKDANAWAEYAMPVFRDLIQIKRQQVGRSGFSKLGSAEARANHRPRRQA